LSRAGLTELSQFDFVFESVDHSFKKKQLARIESSGFYRNSLGDPTKPRMASFAFRIHQLFPRLPLQLQRSSLSSARVAVNNVGTFHPSITCAAAQASTSAIEKPN
jgi:hypothetical protein